MKQILVITNYIYFATEALNIVTSAMKQKEIATVPLHINNTSAMKQNKIATVPLHINNTA